MKKALTILLAMTLIFSMLSGCGKITVQNGDQHSNNSTNDNNTSENNTAPFTANFSQTDADMFSNRDHKTDYNTDDAVLIQLKETIATASSNSVTISGSKITITEEATYIISGTLSNGMIIVNAKNTDKLHLVFNGVNITSKTSAALYILEADKVFLTLADGTSNSIANGGSFQPIDNNNIDGALFSKQDLTMNGNGSLTVTSPAGHGIVCKDDLVVTGGTYTIHSASHGLDANDSVRIAKGNLTIDAGKDAIRAENNNDNSKGFIYISGGSITAEAEGDGISASAYMQIEDGTINLLVGGGSKNGNKQHSDFFGGFMGGGQPGGKRPNKMQKTNAVASTDDGTSMKALKSTNSLLIAGGNISINSADDSVHSDASVIINGGTLTIASGDDAIHAEETLTVTGGKIDISECYEGLEALHIDVNGGTISLKASDDGLNAAGGKDQSGTDGGRDGMFGGGRPGSGKGGPGGMSSNSNGTIRISGGTLYINSSGDGIDANGTLEISGGHTTITGPTQGDTATLDYDKSGIITGGTFIGTGSTMMAQSFSDSEQGVIAIKSGNQAAGTQIVLQDSNGNVIISHNPELDFAVVILSTPELTKGEKYTLKIGSKTSELVAS